MHEQLPVAVIGAGPVGLAAAAVPRHGVDELSHPDAGVYVVGMKSHGREPTFLLRTGHGRELVSDAA
jgi:hypothetical protein